MVTNQKSCKSFDSLVRKLLILNTEYGRKSNMKTRNRKSGYSVNTANEYIDSKQAIHCLSVEFEPQIRFEEGQPTGEIIAYKAWFSQKGLPPFMVKFENEATLPAYMAMVQFENLQACEVGFNVYFKADNLKEVK
ncbi:hypothetical protein HSISS2_103 [Streptococcus sp. HSISS2]|nr:hypothetical protein HSISS2_103 [Streptococcus sp. HSISS2]